MKRSVGFIITLMTAGALITGPVDSAFAQEKKEGAKTEAKKSTPAFMNAWKSIQSTVTKKRTSKTTQGIATAGVRGDEAEDQIVSQMYFRGGTTYPTRSKIQNAIILLTETVNEAEDPASTAESRFYIGQCYIELGETDKAIASFEEVTKVDSKSEWSNRAKAEIKLLKK
jgi:hypothetical protein